jgi:DNA polymerase-3 subunit epsilon
MRRKLIVVDTETGGFDPSKNAILQFGAVIYHDGSISGTFSSMICDAGEIIDESLGVHALDVRSLQSQWDSPWLVIQKFKNWLATNELYGKQTLAAHNATFDSGFLRRLWRLADQDFDEQFDYRMLCTQTAALLLEQAGRLQLPGGNASLDNVALALGLQPEPKPHDALNGATLAAKVLAKMVERLK